MEAPVERAVSTDYLREVVERLASLGSHPLGFRVAGTPEEREATRFVVGEMRDLGLVDVAEEPVPVDAWRLREAFVESEGGGRYEAASMGGVPETGRAGVRGELVIAGAGSRRELEGVDLSGKVVLVDWRDERLWPYDVALELGLRGAAAMILTSLPDGPYYQADGALGTFDAMWHEGAPPMVTIRKEDAAELLVREGEPVRVVLVAPLERSAEAANVVGTLPGRGRGGPVIVGGHHDGWFKAAFDDATGVAVTLALARACVEAHVRPRRPLVFVSHTAEEYGIAESRYDWCYGAWYQVVETHREWGAGAAFYLNVEGSGYPAPLGVDAPPELRVWARRLCRVAERDGLLPLGWRLGRPSTWTEVWTFLAAGVPGINVSTFSAEYKRTLYHTQYDTTDRVDVDYLAALTRLYSRFLLDAAADPDGILDYGARAREVARSAPELADTADGLRDARGRRRFTALGRGLYGLDAGDAPAYP
ncbi:MAG: M28 family peptidase, partial [Actinomycetota bacterium]|nr:M28 family peptidase [Actinomycetota bacterium]